MSMYPPGVTGNEWQIAGPDSEAEEDHLCVPCDAVTTHAVVWFQGMAWKTCEDCLYESCIGDSGEDDGPDDARQEEIENYREETW